MFGGGWMQERQELINVVADAASFRRHLNNMGCGSSQPSARIAPRAPPEKAKNTEEKPNSTANTTDITLISDPRWDKESFDALVTNVPLLRVGYLRSLYNNEAAKLSAASVPKAEKHRSLPSDCGVSGKAIYAVLSPSLMLASPSARAELKAVLDVLKEAADDDDFIFWSHLCVTSVNSTVARDELFRMFTHVSCTPCTFCARRRCETLRPCALCSRANSTASKRSS